MGAKITLTPEQESWIKKHFKHTKNDDIARRLGISARSVNRIASELGLKKSRQFMQKTQQNAANKANESHRRNGTYPPKGYVIPRSEEFRFRKGEKPIDRIGAKRESERIRKGAESRARLRNIEKARALYGLPRHTKLNVVKRPVKQIWTRHYLRERGYLVERGSNTAYYDSNTKRSPNLEARPRTGFTFLPLTQE